MLKKVIKDAFPTVLAFTMSGMYSVVDGMFVGRAAGDTGLAAINIAWPIPALITADRMRNRDHSRVVFDPDSFSRASRSKWNNPGGSSEIYNDHHCRKYVSSGRNRNDACFEK